MHVVLMSLSPAPDSACSFQLQAELWELSVNFNVHQNHLEDLLKHR